MTDTSFQSKIYKSRTHLLEQLKYQGYNISAYECFSLDTIDIMYNNNQLDMTFYPNESNNEAKTEDVDDITNIIMDTSIDYENAPKHKTHVKYMLDKSLKSAHLHDIRQGLIDMNLLSDYDTIYIITLDDVNDNILNEIIKLWNLDKINYIVYPLKNLLFNILHHEWVSKHKIIRNTVELDAIKQKYSIVSLKDQLPQSSRFDPVYKALGVRPEEIVLELKASKTSVLIEWYWYCANIKCK